MTDQTPTDAQAAREALLATITEHAQAVRGSGMNFAAKTSAIKSLATAYSLVIGGTQPTTNDDDEK
ncbi:hypothetical protein ACMA46_11805 [Clavibacter sp. Sh2141]|uniref:hypothetical protein n=1 Tax=Clavibacter sp. Sh2141 TaxID=3395374 RepID=UPI0039BD52A7